MRVSPGIVLTYTGAPTPIAYPPLCGTLAAFSTSVDPSAKVASLQERTPSFSLQYLSPFLRSAYFATWPGRSKVYPALSVLPAVFVCPSVATPAYDPPSPHPRAVKFGSSFSLVLYFRRLVPLCPVHLGWSLAVPLTVLTTPPPLTTKHRSPPSPLRVLTRGTFQPSSLAVYVCPIAGNACLSPNVTFFF